MTTEMIVHSARVLMAEALGVPVAEIAEPEIETEEVNR